MKADGYSLDDKRTKIDADDIPDIIARYNNLEKEEERERTEQSFLVPKEDIVANGLPVIKHPEAGILVLVLSRKSPWWTQ